MNVGDLVGKPFEDGGRGPDAFDCWGLVRFAYHQFLDIDLVDYNISAYSSSMVDHKIRCHRKEWQRVEVPKPFDVVLMSLDPLDGRFITHAGFCLNACQFMQCIEKHGVIVSRFRDIFWESKIRGVYRWQG